MRYENQALKFHQQPQAAAQGRANLKPPAQTATPYNLTPPPLIILENG